MEKVSQLQQALSSLQIQNEKREQSEKKLRSTLESELTELKRHLASTINNNPSSRRPSGEPTNCPTYGAPPPYPGANPQQHQNTPHKSDCQSELQQLHENLRLSEEKIRSLTAVVCRWEKFFGSEEPEKSGHSNQPASASAPQTPSSWTSSRGGTPHFFGSGSSSGGNTPGNLLDEFSSAQSRASDLEWKIKDLESRLVERDAVIRALHMGSVTPPPVSSSQHYGLNKNASNTVSSTSQLAPGYRESPHYTSAGGANSLSSGGYSPSPKSSNPLLFNSNGSPIDPALFYSRVAKCESEPPPSYANVPLKTRLGGSGSSLAKNSNESLSPGVGLQSSLGSNSGNFVLGTPSSSLLSNRNSHERNIDEQLKELDQQILTKVKEMELEYALLHK